MPINKQKSRLRQSLKLKRGALTEDQRLACDQAICEQLLGSSDIGRADTVFCYVSSADEVNTRALMEPFIQMNKTVLIPKIINREDMIAVAFTGWDHLSPGEMGILTPDSAIEWPAEIALCITPGLGFTTQGKRIGFGGGYYDKWFRTKPQTRKIALSYECQIVKDIPTTKTDVLMDAIITEQRLITINPAYLPAASSPASANDRQEASR